jgi:hypothetical protein
MKKYYIRGYDVTKAENEINDTHTPYGLKPQINSRSACLIRRARLRIKATHVEGAHASCIQNYYDMKRASSSRRLVYLPTFTWIYSNTQTMALFRENMIRTVVGGKNLSFLAPAIRWYIDTVVGAVSVGHLAMHLVPDSMRRSESCS